MRENNKMIIIDTDYKKRFLKGFQKLCHGSKHPYEVWQDMISLFAISIQNSCTAPLKETEKYKDIWQEREEKYLCIIKKYNKNEQKLFPQMLGLLVMEYERKPFQDLLGQIYMMSGISNKNNGQFFTPYGMCQIMARITMDRKSVGKIVHQRGYVSINDSTCGAGATLIAAVEHCNRNLFKKYNYQNHVYCVGQDIDETCAMMCYVQLSLLPIAGYVIVGNTLSEPNIKDNRRIWYTPLWFSDVWQYRRIFHNMDVIMRSKEEQNENKCI